MAEEIQRDVARRAVRLSKAQRAVAAVVGVSCFALAALSILLKGLDGSAVLALVVVAGLFSFLGVAGVVPTRLQSGEQSMELYDELRTAELEAAADVMTPEQIQEAVGAVEAEESLPVESGFLNEYARFEREARETVARAAARLGLTYIDEAGGRPTRWDGLVRTSEDKQIVVEYKLNLRSDRLLDTLFRIREATDQPVLIITSRRPRGRTLSRADSRMSDWVLVENDPVQVESALRTLAGLQS